MKPYRPGNGTEGDFFMAAHCDSCGKQPTCKIPMLTMTFDEDEIGYPPEWVEDDDGSNPRCTAREARSEPGNA